MFWHPHVHELITWIEVSKSSGRRKANLKICPNSPPSVGLGYFWPFVSADWPQWHWLDWEIMGGSARSSWRFVWGREWRKAGDIHCWPLWYALGTGLGWKSSPAFGKKTVFWQYLVVITLLLYQVTETPLGPRNDEENDWTLVGGSWTFFKVLLLLDTFLPVGEWCFDIFTLPTDSMSKISKNLLSFRYRLI